MTCDDGIKRCRRRDVLQRSHGHGGSGRHGRQALARQHSVVIVAIAVRELRCNTPRGYAVIAIVLRHASAPVHGVGHFVGSGIKLNLLLEILLGLILAVLPIGQPGALPVRIGGFGAFGKALVDFAIVIDGAIVVLVQQVHVAGAQQSRLQPRRLRRGGPHVLQDGVQASIVLGIAGNFGPLIPLLRAGLAAVIGNAIQRLAGVAGIAVLHVRVGQLDQPGRLLPAGASRPRTRYSSAAAG